jgi:hypothetical protein
MRVQVGFGTTALKSSIRLLELRADFHEKDSEHVQSLAIDFTPNAIYGVVCAAHFDEARIPCFEKKCAEVFML